MKLSTSSSFFFATLALSSSSSTLAAPAGDVTDSGLSVSPSTHDMFDSSVHPAAHCSAHRTQPTPVESNSGAIALRSTSDLQDTVGQVVALLKSIPIIGPVVGAILDVPTVGGLHLAETDGVSEHGISANDMAALQAAIQEITRALSNNTAVSNAPAPSPVKNVASGLPRVAQSDFDPAVAAVAPGSTSVMSSTQLSSTPPSTPSVAINDVPSSSSAFPSASATRPSFVVPVNLPSPSLPINPPISPSLPIHPPV